MIEYTRTHLVSSKEKTALLFSCTAIRSRTSRRCVDALFAMSPTSVPPSGGLDQRISILTIAVHDFERSRQFYNKVFGWVPIQTSEEEEKSIAFYQLKGFQLALYPLAKFREEHGGEVTAPRGFTAAYNVNSEGEVDALFGRFETSAFFMETGGKVLKLPTKVFWGGYSGYIAGPSGEQWEIAFNPFTKVNDDGTFGG